MREVIFSLHHHDCWGPKVAEKFPGLTIELQNLSISRTGKKDGAVCSALWLFSSDADTELAQALDYAKGYKTTKKFEVLERTPGNARVFMVIKPINGFAIDQILDNACVISRPLLINEGMERWGVITENPSNVGKVLGELREIGELKIARIGDGIKAKASKEVTDKQSRAFEAAVSQGYYEWPKQITLKELALMSGVSRTTYQNHLRKAESRIMKRMRCDRMV